VTDQRSDAGAVTSDSASGNVIPGTEGTPLKSIPDIKEEVQRVVAGMFKDYLPRMIKKAMGESLTPEALTNVVEQAIVKMAGGGEDTSTGGGEPGTTATAKAGNGAQPGAAGNANQEVAQLKQQFEKELQGLKKQLKERDQAAKQAEEGARQTTLRTAVQQKLAAALGPDNPNLGPLMDSLFDVKKRFKYDEQGGMVMAFQARDAADGQAFERLVPLEEAIPEWVKAEGKAYIPARSANLPPHMSFLRQPTGLQPSSASQSVIPDRMPDGRPNPVAEMFGAMHSDLFNAGHGAK